MGQRSRRFRPSWPSARVAHSSANPKEHRSRVARRTKLNEDACLPALHPRACALLWFVACEKLRPIGGVVKAGRFDGRDQSASVAPPPNAIQIAEHALCAEADDAQARALSLRSRLASVRTLPALEASVLRTETNARVAGPLAQRRGVRIRTQDCRPRRPPPFRAQVRRAEHGIWEAGSAQPAGRALDGGGNPGAQPAGRALDGAGASPGAQPAGRSLDGAGDPAEGSNPSLSAAEGAPSLTDEARRLHPSVLARFAGCAAPTSPKAVLALGLRAAGGGRR